MAVASTTVCARLGGLLHSLGQKNHGRVVKRARAAPILTALLLTFSLAKRSAIRGRTPSGGRRAPPVPRILKSPHQAVLF